MRTDDPMLHQPTEQAAVVPWGFNRRRLTTCPLQDIIGHTLDARRRRKARRKQAVAADSAQRPKTALNQPRRPPAMEWKALEYRFFYSHDANVDLGCEVVRLELPPALLQHEDGK